MARSLDLPPEVKAKLDNPRAKVFTTLARVFDSSVGREFLRVDRDSEHGLRGKTTAAEFTKGFSKIVSDIALGHQSSRTLNKNEDIASYFKKLDEKFVPKKKAASFVPADIIKGRSVASSIVTASSTKVKKPKQSIKTVLPRSLAVRYGSERLIDIRGELVRLKREGFPNSGAVLLRVFFELAVVDYLTRTGELPTIIDRLGGKGKLPFGVPTMRQLVPFLIAIVKKKMSHADATKVEKSIRYDAAAPFTLSDLHSFIHQANDLPSARDILQFWLRTEPLFRLMLETDPGSDE